MTKQVYGQNIRLTKTGLVHKADRSKVIQAIQSQIESEVRSWEFLAGIDGKDSISALNALKRIDALKSELTQTETILGLVA